MSKKRQVLTVAALIKISQQIILDAYVTHTTNAD